MSAEEKDVEADVKTAQEPAPTEGTFYNDERPVSGQDLVWVDIAWRICMLLGAPAMLRSVLAA